MIARIRGPVLSIKAQTVVVDCGGVGYRLSCSQSALDGLALGKVADLHTHLIVREDDMSLYGFSGDDEVAFFQLLLSVSGIGARTALAMMSRLSADQLRTAISTGQIDTLSRVPGIGKKTAEKIIFALKGKLGGLDGAPGAVAVPMTMDDTEVIAALTNLGFSIVEAQTALASLPRDEPMDLEEKIRRALAGMG